MQFNNLTILLYDSYPMASSKELAENSDNCAICWEKMESARKLPCTHLFHKWVPKSITINQSCISPIINPLKINCCFNKNKEKQCNSWVSFIIGRNVT